MSEIESFVAEHAEELRGDMRDPREMVSPDAMGAASAYVEREYGYGYRLGVVSSSFGGAGLFGVCAADGSRFRVYADRWGNVARVPDESTVADAACETVAANIAARLPL